jgi:hypothetical protein
MRTPRVGATGVGRDGCVCWSPSAQRGRDSSDGHHDGLTALQRQLARGASWPRAFSEPKTSSGGKELHRAVRRCVTMPTAAELRDTVRELVCDELKARGVCDAALHVLVACHSLLSLVSEHTGGVLPLPLSPRRRRCRRRQAVRVRPFRRHSWFAFAPPLSAHSEHLLSAFSARCSTSQIAPTARTAPSSTVSQAGRRRVRCWGTAQSKEHTALAGRCFAQHSFILKSPAPRAVLHCPRRHYATLTRLLARTFADEASATRRASHARGVA